MGLTTGQIIAFIRNYITDPTNRQNTALKVRTVLEKFATDYFNKVSDKLPINQVEGLEIALGNTAATTINDDHYIATVAGGQPAITKTAAKKFFCVSRNGVVLTHGRQYTDDGAGNLVILAAGAVAVDDEVQFFWTEGTAAPLALAVQVSAQRVATMSGLAAGKTFADYEYQFRPAPTVSSQRVVDMSLTLGAGQTFNDYEFQSR